MNKTINDNAAAPSAGESWRGLEPHGEAALLLSESLLHGLIAASLITVRQAADIVANAVEVSQELADVNGSSPDGATSSLALLTAIRSSLAFDLPEG